MTIPCHYATFGLLAPDAGRLRGGMGGSGPRVVVPEKGVAFSPVSDIPGLEALSVLRVDVADGIATVTIARPPVNAQNGRFRDEIIRIFDMLHDTPEVLAVVLTGAGRVFSAGADLKERPGCGSPGAYPRHGAVRAGFDCVMECEKPVICAINGAAIGAGCVLALSANILVAGERLPVDDRGGCRPCRRREACAAPLRQSDARLMI